MMTEENRIPEDAEIPECDCCGYKAELEKVTGRRTYGVSVEEHSYNLCEICRSTFAGNIMFYPGQYENHPLIKIVAYIGNMILEAIKKEG